MADDTTEDMLDTLDSILERERQALTGGALDALPELMAEKDALIERIGALDARERERLGPLRDKVTRNQALLDSALSGIRAVAGRMAELRRVRAGLETYDQAGRKTRYGVQERTKVSKRA